MQTNNMHVLVYVTFAQTLSFLSWAEYKKARQEIKKKSSDTLKLQKKAKKGIYNAILRG